MKGGVYMIIVLAIIIVAMYVVIGILIKSLNDWKTRAHRLAAINSRLLKRIEKNDDAD